MIIIMETGWDLRPCCSVAMLALGHASSLSNQIQRNCMELKITACMQQLWQILAPKDEKKKKKKPTLNATFEEPGAKAGKVK